MISKSVPWKSKICDANRGLCLNTELSLSFPAAFPVIASLDPSGSLAAASVVSTDKAQPGDAVTAVSGPSGSLEYLAFKDADVRIGSAVEGLIEASMDPVRLQVQRPVKKVRHANLLEAGVQFRFTNIPKRKCPNLWSSSAIMQCVSLLSMTGVHEQECRHLESRLHRGLANSRERRQSSKDSCKFPFSPLVACVCTLRAARKYLKQNGTDN